MYYNKEEFNGKQINVIYFYRKLCPFLLNVCELIIKIFKSNRILKKMTQEINIESTMYICIYNNHMYVYI